MITDRIKEYLNFFRGMKAVDAAALSLVFSLGNRGGSGQGVVGRGMKLPEATEKGYKNMVWVYRCVRVLSQSVGSPTWKAYRPGSQADSFDPAPGHPLEKLFAQPNFYSDRRTFLETWAAHLALSGNAYWEIVRVQGRPYYLFPLRPDRIRPIPDPVNYISGYEMDKGTGKPEILEPERVVHFKFIDPMDEYVGMSPLQAAARTMKGEDSAIMWNQTVFDNSAIPGGVLKIPAQVLQTEDRSRLREELLRDFTKENMNSPMILWGGMEWTKISLSQQDMDFLNQRRLNKLEFCAVYGIPPQCVGAVEDPTYSNYSVSRLSLWEDTIIPLLDWLQNRINITLAPAFGDGVQLRYDLSSIPAMREAFTQKVKTAKDLWTMGWPINSINHRLDLGMEDVAWGDTAWMPSSQVPVGSLAEPVGAEPGSPDAPNFGDDEEELDDVISIPAGGDNGAGKRYVNGSGRAY